MNDMKRKLVHLEKQHSVSPGKRLFGFIGNNAIRNKPYMCPGDFFRASGLGYVCPREEVLASRYEFVRQEHISPSLQITFDIGHAFHDLYRDSYFGPMGIWLGAWECLHCGWSTDDDGTSEPPVQGKYSGRLAKMPAECGGCGAPFFVVDHASRTYGTFKEWYVQDEEFFINGHPDGWVAHNGRMLTDLKSKSAKSFPTLRSVEPAHVPQVLGYQRMCSDTNGAVWYMNKSPWGDASMFLRDFAVPYNEEAFRRLVAEPMEELQNGLSGGVLPDRICPAATCSRAKECQLNDVCWQ